jgi:hypothetical protein
VKVEGLNWEWYCQYLMVFFNGLYEVWGCLLWFVCEE